MKCIKCGHTMEPAAPATLIAEVRGERLEVQVVAPHCKHCGRVVLDSKGRRMYGRAGADAYRSRHGLLTTHQLDQMRRDLGMTWKQFAEYVSVGIATLKRWMGGEIQTPSLDLLVRLKADLNFARRAADELLTRLAANATEYMPGAAMLASPANRRTRTRPAVEWQVGAANTDLADAA
jgi:putative zinc finger/helix-turn-helix YgiT family protein